MNSVITAFEGYRNLARKLKNFQTLSRLLIKPVISEDQNGVKNALKTLHSLGLMDSEEDIRNVHRRYYPYSKQYQPLKRQVRGFVPKFVDLNLYGPFRRSFYIKKFYKDGFQIWSKDRDKTKVDKLVYLYTDKIFGLNKSPIASRVFTKFYEPKFQKKLNELFRDSVK